VRDLRRVHSHIAALAYPVLDRAAGSRDRGALPVPAATEGLIAEAGSLAEPGERR